MSLPARFQHHQPLGTRRAQAHPRPRPGRPVVYAISTKRVPKHAWHRLSGKDSGWRDSSKSAGGAFLRWDAELFKNYTEVK